MGNEITILWPFSLWECCYIDGHLYMYSPKIPPLVYASTVTVMIACQLMAELGNHLLIGRGFLLAKCESIFLLIGI